MHTPNEIERKRRTDTPPDADATTRAQKPCEAKRGGWEKVATGRPAADAHRLGRNGARQRVPVIRYAARYHPPQRNPETDMENAEASAELTRIAMLEGQARLMHGMLVAVIAALDRKQRAQCSQAMAVIWSDLQADLRPQPSGKRDPVAQNQWNGANTTWNLLQTDLDQLLGP